MNLFVDTKYTSNPHLLGLGTPQVHCQPYLYLHFGFYIRKANLCFDDTMSPSPLFTITYLINNIESK